MNQDPLHQFAKQLHIWATDHLREKPGPFRTVDLYPVLLGEKEFLSPPIVFWINRESHLAAGVILLPKNNLSEVAESGRKISAALGLESYYTWGIGEVSAWGVTTPSVRLWSELIPVTALHETDSSRKILTLLLQEMQSRFFGGEQQRLQPSTPYLTNLLHSCIESALLISSPDRSNNADRSPLACIVLQMLALHSMQALPARTGPESLIDDLNLEMQKLPVPLRTALSLPTKSLQPPREVKVKLHHLHQRLQQLGSEITPLLPEAISRLLWFWSEAEALAPLPALLGKNCSTLIINPDRYHPDESVAIEIAPPLITAATAFLRSFQDRDREHPDQHSDLLDLRKPITVDEVIGNVSDHSMASIYEQKQFNTILRHSWPNRHIKFTATTPRWVWRVIHLVGLLQGTPQGVLNLPADWLWAAYGEHFFTLLSERVELNRISPLENHSVRIEFNRSNNNRQLTVDSFDNDIRLIERNAKELTRTDILLALTLPTDILDLLRSGELKTTTDFASHLDAVELFLHSSIGRGLWQILAPKKQLPKLKNMMTEIIRTGLPLPGKNVLTALSRSGGKQIHPDKAAIDRELQVWLGSAALTALHPGFKPTPAKMTSTPEINPAEKIAATLIKAGEIPSFPTDYLYATPEKSRRQYLIPGPLSVRETFFDRIIMQTPGGDTMQVEGVATAQALELISTIQKTEITLPDEEPAVEIILNRYLHDLQRLYATVQQHAGTADYRDKEELADQIWRHLQVPPRGKLNNG